MRHYIYLEENRVIYARARGWLVGRAGHLGHLEKLLPECRVWEREGESLETVFKRLSDYHGLRGKKAALALGLDLSFCGMTLPAGRRSVVERMAQNQLAVNTGFGAEYAAAVDIVHGRTGRKVSASLFYMEKSRLTEYKAMAAAAGINFSCVLAVPQCMAVAAQKMWRERSHLVVDVEEGQLGLYLVSRGHCLAFETTALKAGRFCRMQGEELLYQEIAERAERLFGLPAESGGEGAPGLRPECAVLLGDCLPSWEEGASRLEKLLRLPCFSRRMEGEANVKKAIPIGLLAACVGGCCHGKGRGMNVRGRDREGWGGWRGIGGGRKG